MDLNQKEQYRALMKKYRIHFDGPVTRNAWPASHTKTFSDIQKLGRIDFSLYQESISVDSDFHPWREQTRRRAERIAELAMLCYRGRRNEAGWRLLLESEILVRFTIEVTCRSCRARLWRSELEASLSAPNQFAESLEERRKRRLPCSCNPTRWKEEPHEQGVSLLFDDRAEEEILHSPTVMADLPKKREKPDRVYGLRITKRLERLLLWSEDKRASSGGKTIGESIRSTPFRADGEPVLFPFLVIEAKSEKGREGFSDIEVQTAFAIRTLLELQQDLADAVGEDSSSETSPLVWFLSYRGEQWRVSAAFIKYDAGVKTYRIVDLWDGRLVPKEGALRLLLIIDYIFDWARDIYRETIISELRSLSASDTHSLSNDSDVISMLDRLNFSSMEIGLDDNTQEPANEIPPVVGSVYHRLDSAYGAVRDARSIRSRFMSLYITEDNLSAFMTSMRTTEQAKSAARAILRFLRDCWRVSAEALDNIEQMWTGKDRENENLYRPTKCFLVMVTLSAYLSPSWEQTRELSYLAVSVDAIEALVRHADQKIVGDWKVSQLPYIDKDVFVGWFRAFRSITIEDNLFATISRACLSSRLFSQESNRKKTKESSMVWLT
ncbi:uncharacterized protein BDZ99DRAFT_533885, partial [Mytilinidion resinicola]